MEPEDKAEIGTAVAQAASSVPEAASQSDVIKGLMEIAIQQGDAGVDALERLVALQERVMDRDANNQLMHALAAFQEKCPPIRKSRDADIKTKSGASYRYTYASLDDIVASIRELLPEFGLSYTWDSGVVDSVLTVRCIVRHVAGASVEATFQCPTDNPSNISAAQKVGAALTYARRQSLCQALGLTTTDADVDGADLESKGALITEAQLREIRALVTDSGANIDRFLNYVGVESLDKIPLANFGMAKRTLEARRQSNRGAR